MAIYMKYPGCDGDVTAPPHDKWIMCHSISFSESRDVPPAQVGGTPRKSRPVQVGDITLGKPMCAASSALFKESIGGTGKDVLIHISRTGADGTTNYLEITLTDCCVSHYNVSSDGARHLESVNLHFSTIELRYIPVGTDNKPGEAITAKINIPTGAVS
jgi:type VI secretion system secreted protein Hcp